MAGPTHREKEQFLDVALSAARGAAYVTRATSAGNFTCETKADGSPVTNVDRAVETLIRRDLKQAFPDHGITGEECGADASQSDYRWYIDPIDGTVDFTRGLPFYGTLLFLCHRRRPVVSLISHPGLGLLTHATLGGGAFANGERLSLNDDANMDVSEQVIAAGEVEGFRMSGTLTRYRRLLDLHPMVRTLGGCFAQTLVARGALGGMVDNYTHYWDYGGVGLLVEEAGGRHMLLAGKKRSDGQGTHTMICGHPGVVEWLSGLFTGKGQKASST